MSASRKVTKSAHLAGASLDLPVQPLVFNGEPHRRGHRLGKVGIAENGAVVDQCGHGPAVALEQRDRTALSIGR